MEAQNLVENEETGVDLLPEMSVGRPHEDAIQAFGFVNLKIWIWAMSE